MGGLRLAGIAETLYLLIFVGYAAEEPLVNEKMVRSLPAVDPELEEQEETVLGLRALEGVVQGFVVIGDFELLPKLVEIEQDFFQSCSPPEISIMIRLASPSRALDSMTMDLPFAAW